MVYIWLIITVFLIVILFWLTIFFLANDVSVPLASISKYKNILVIFPHPDDEVLTAGGLMRTLSNSGKKVNLIILSKGERGRPGFFIRFRFMNIIIK